jgi:hypothetical protein
MHAILRSFNDPRVTEIIASLEATGQISDVWVAINSEVDRIDTAKLLRSYTGGLSVMPVPLENYGWSKALNTCLRIVMEKAPGNDRILIVSNQVNRAGNKRSGPRRRSERGFLRLRFIQRTKRTHLSDAAQYFYRLEAKCLYRSRHV